MMAGGTRKIKITNLNPHLACVLCGGYYIDATTIIECLHSFCKTCIVRYLETSKYCPICDVQVHKTRPYLNIRPDQTLQDLVYKLVPGLFTNEMRKRRDFYAKNPVAGTSSGEPTGDATERERLIYAEDEKISLCLEFSPNGKPVLEKDEKQSSEKENSKNEKQNDKSGKCQETKKEVEEDSSLPSKRFLLCPAAFSVGHLKKFIRLKFGLGTGYDIDIFHIDEPLCDQYTLMDIAYIYTWRRLGPLRLFYTIYESLNPPPSKRAKVEKSQNTTTSQQQSITKPASVLTSNATSPQTSSPSPKTPSTPKTYSTPQASPKPPSSPKAVLASPIKNNTAPKSPLSSAKGIAALQVKDSPIKQTVVSNKPISIKVKLPDPELAKFRAKSKHNSGGSGSGGSKSPSPSSSPRCESPRYKSEVQRQHPQKLIIKQTSPQTPSQQSPQSQQEKQILRVKKTSPPIKETKTQVTQTSLFTKTPSPSSSPRSPSKLVPLSPNGSKSPQVYAHVGQHPHLPQQPLKQQKHQQQKTGEQPQKHVLNVQKHLLVRPSTTTHAQLTSTGTQVTSKPASGKNRPQSGSRPLQPIKSKPSTPATPSEEDGGSPTHIPLTTALLQSTRTYPPHRNQSSSTHQAHMKTQTKMLIQTTRPLAAPHPTLLQSGHKTSSAGILLPATPGKSRSSPTQTPPPSPKHTSVPSSPSSSHPRPVQPSRGQAQPPSPQKQKSSQTSLKRPHSSPVKTNQQLQAGPTPPKQQNKGEQHQGQQNQQQHKVHSAQPHRQRPPLLSGVGRLSSSVHFNRKDSSTQAQLLPSNHKQFLFKQVVTSSVAGGSVTSPPVTSGLRLQTSQTSGSMSSIRYLHSGQQRAHVLNQTSNSRSPQSSPQKQQSHKLHHHQQTVAGAANGRNVGHHASSPTLTVAKISKTPHPPPASPPPATVNQTSPPSAGDKGTEPISPENQTRQSPIGHPPSPAVTPMSPQRVRKTMSPLQSPIPTNNNNNNNNKPDPNFSDQPPEASVPTTPTQSNTNQELNLVQNESISPANTSIAHAPSSCSGPRMSSSAHASASRSFPSEQSSAPGVSNGKAEVKEETINREIKTTEVSLQEEGTLGLNQNAGPTPAPAHTTPADRRQHQDMHTQTAETETQTEQRPASEAEQDAPLDLHRPKVVEVRN